MTRSIRLFPVLVTLSFSVAIAGQSQSPAALTASLRTHLQTEQFQIVSTIRGFPLGVRDKLAELFGTGSLDIANPGEPFERSGGSHQTLPPRRLVFGGCATDNHCVIYYERGSATVTHRAALFHWSPAETKLEFGGVAPAGLATVEALTKAILSGAVKPGSSPW